MKRDDPLRDVDPPRTRAAVEDRRRRGRVTVGAQSRTDVAAAREAAASSHSSRAPIPRFVADLREDIRTGYGELGPDERAALESWLGFTGAFVGARVVTHAIKDKAGPFRNVSVGGVHLHHYMWGIAMLANAGAVAIHGPDRWRRSPVVTTHYGIGLGLIVDEFALLADLEDVYWSKQGRLSVEVGVGMISVGGTLLAALPILRRITRRYKSPSAR
jgi:hypothetical protein